MTAVGDNRVTTPHHIVRDVCKKSSDDVLSAIERNIFLIEDQRARESVSLACLRAAMCACIEIHLLGAGKTSVGSNGKALGEAAIAMIKEMAESNYFEIGGSDAGQS